MDRFGGGKAERGYMRARLRVVAVVAVIFLCAGMFPSCSLRGEVSIIIAGSTSVQPYVEVVMEEFGHLNPDIKIDIQGGGSSAGITAVISNTADIGMSSRSLKDSEQHLWSVEIAKDGLAVIINPGNPVENISLEQIRGIYAAEIVNWSELGGPNAKIHIITREEGSGTRSAFEELVMAGRRISPRAIVQDSNGAVRQLVSDDVNSIGFISLGLVEIGEKPVKPLKLDGVIASRGNVINGSYSLYRPFLFISGSRPEGAVSQFIDFILSTEGQHILSVEGLIPE